MLVGLIKDESEKYDSYNWHDEYATHFNSLGVRTELLDFKKKNWLEKVLNGDHDCYLWRPWHVPWDRDDAKQKIYFLDKILGKVVFPNWDMYWHYDDKVSQLYLMETLKIPHPSTFYIRDREEAIEFLNSCSLPIISKSSEGACGDNVKLFEDRKNLENHIKKIFSRNGISTYFPGRHQQMYLYLQEFIPTERDLRLITIGNRVELAFWREAQDWKKNISKGARINSKDIPPKSITLVQKISDQLKMHWCAYDLIELNGDFLVLEFSSVFGFSSKQYATIFGSRNGHILFKQASYIKELMEKNGK